MTIGSGTPELRAVKYLDVKGHTIYDANDIARSVAVVKHADPARQERLANLMAASGDLYDALNGLVGWAEGVALPGTAGGDAANGQALLDAAHRAMNKAWGMAAGVEGRR